MLPTVNIFNQYPKNVSFSGSLWLVIIATIGTMEIPISLLYLRLDRLKMFEAANHLSRWVRPIYTYIYDITWHHLCLHDQLDNLREWEGLGSLNCWGVSLTPTKGALGCTFWSQKPSKNPSSENASVNRVRNVTNDEAMSGCSEQNRAETKKSRVANYSLLNNVVEGSQMSLVYNGTVHHGIEGISAQISNNKDSTQRLQLLLWALVRLRQVIIQDVGILSKRKQQITGSASITGIHQVLRSFLHDTSSHLLIGLS